MTSWDLGEGDLSAWRATNTQLAAPPLPPKGRPWWRRNLRWLVLLLAADLVVGSVLWRWLRDEASTPERAVIEVVELVGAKDWQGLRDALCAPDRARYTVADLAQAGSSFVLAMRGVAGFEVGRVTAVPDVKLGPVGLPTRRVDGRVVAALGPGSPAHVTVVQEPTAWKVCLSAGGYGVASMNVDVPPAEGLLDR